MSHAWVVCVKDKLIKKNKENISVLKKVRSKGKLNSEEKKTLKSLKEKRFTLKYLEKEQKDLKQIEKHINNKNYRRRIFRTKVEKGILKITTLDMVEKDGNVVEKTPDGRSRIESSSKNFQQNKTPREISLKNPPKSGSDRKVYNKYFKNLEAALTKSRMTKSASEKTVRELKQAYIAGDVVNEAGKKGQAKFLKNRMISDLGDQIKNESNMSKKIALMAKKNLLIHSDKMGNIFKSNWFMGGVEKIQKHTRDLGLHRSVRYTKGVITRSGKLLVRVPKGVVTGMGAGLAIVAFDAGDAYVDFAKGQILLPELNRKIADAAITGSVIGSGTAVAVALGANPVGFVVLAIGIGGYMITDLAVKHWHQYQDRKYLTSEDLKVFGLTMKDTIPLRMDKWNPDIPLNIENWGR